jgi:hypothetical protein
MSLTTRWHLQHEIVERYKRFVVPLRNQLNIKSMEEWYHVDTKALKGSDSTCGSF